MHNAVFTDLADAMRFYSERDGRPERWCRRGKSGRADEPVPMAAATRLS